MHIFVGNLNHEITEGELRDAFEQFGEVSGVNILKDHLSGESRGFGFVEMPEPDAAQAAIHALNTANFKGKAMTVSEARARRGRYPGTRRRPRSNSR